MICSMCTSIIIHPFLLVTTLPHKNTKHYRTTTSFLGKKDHPGECTPILEDPDDGFFSKFHDNYDFWVKIMGFFVWK